MSRLIVVTGPTGSGKTELAIQTALRLGCEIISADSRQIYRGIPIGTAAPTPQDLARVRHHFVGTLELDAAYSAAAYEADVMRLLPGLLQRDGVAVMCGGSMMYVDAVCCGIDDLPAIDPDLRRYIMSIYEDDGLEAIRHMLFRLDPESFSRIDPKNPRRNIHAVEISLQSGIPASRLLTGARRERPFAITKVYIDMPRAELFDRINHRTLLMMEQGLEQEARSVHHLRHLNSLNTVGYKEMFEYFDGAISLDTAVERIARNTRVYAKKQLTWLKHDPKAVAVTSADDICRLADF